MPKKSTLAITSTLNAKQAKSLSQSLLRWYGAHGRKLPWRVGAGKKANPYHVLLSEFMLQQTQIATGLPYFHAFIKRWPTLQAFAGASLEEVRAMWSGLGYYRRAGYLLRCAQEIVTKHKGQIPADEIVLRQLPGIGAYTAAALRVLVHGQKANVVDGNVERVVARYFAIATPLPAAKKTLAAHAALLVPDARVGDYAQALMDLGATLCTPRAPQCPVCPWAKSCAAFRQGMPERYPVKKPKAKIPHKHATFFVLSNKKGEILLRKRQEQGLFAGMWEFPSTPYGLQAATLSQIARHAPKNKRQTINWQQGKKSVTHVFSHFKLTATLRIGHSQTTFLPQDGEYRWIAAKDLATIALPSLMRKIAAAAR